MVVVDPFDPKGVMASRALKTNENNSHSANNNSSDSLNMSRSNNDLDENESCFEV